MTSTVAHKLARMLRAAGARELRAAVMTKGGPRAKIEVIKRSAAGLEAEKRMRGWRAPKLVVTSPPYPGVHVLYHRWRVDLDETSSYLLPWQFNTQS